MLVSMTGYCSINEHVDVPGSSPIPLSIEIKSLNGRFFEVVPKLASSFSHLELPIIALLQEKFVRGKIFLNIRLSDKRNSLESVIPSWAVIDQYIALSKAIQDKHHLSGELSLGNLLGLPNVLVSQEGALNQDTNVRILDLVRKAADMVVRMRLDEGVRLEKDFEKIFTTCSHKIDEVQKGSHAVMENYKEQLKKSLAEHGDNEKPNLQADELSIALRKTDIHEEITRFKSHLASIKPVLDAPGLEKGKRLDFIMQELMRETNTIMAKCPAYDVSALCVDLKVELEKAREQIQNIV